MRLQPRKISLLLTFAGIFLWLNPASAVTVSVSSNMSFCYTIGTPFGNFSFCDAGNSMGGLPDGTYCGSIDSGPAGFTPNNSGGCVALSGAGSFNWSVTWASSAPPPPPPPPPPPAGNTTLTVTINGNGTVSSGGVTCPPTCTVTLPQGTAISLTATPGSGATFSGWGGDCAPFGTGTVCSGDMSVNRNVTANFGTAATNRTLTVTIVGNGTVSSGGVTCPPTCTVTLPSTTTLSLAATPGTGATFIGWGGDCAPFATNLSCTGDMSVDRNVIANFTAANPNRTLTVTVIGNGTVSSGGVTCPPTCTVSLPQGTAISLTATPGSGVSFSGWGGDCASFATNIVCTGSMTGDRNVIASFTGIAPPPPPPSGSGALTVTINGNGTVSSGGVTCPPTCTINLPIGTPLSLTATPGTGATFTGWGGDCASFGAGAICSTSMTANRSIAANFTGVAPPPPIVGPPPPVQTQPQAQQGTAVPLSWNLTNPLYGKPTNIFGVIFLIGDWILNIAASLIVILIIYSGVRFMLSRGNPSETIRAKNILQWALVGFVITMIGKGFIYVIEGLLSGTGVR